MKCNVCGDCITKGIFVETTNPVGIPHDVILYFCSVECLSRKLQRLEYLRME